MTLPALDVAAPPPFETVASATLSAVPLISANQEGSAFGVSVPGSITSADPPAVYPLFKNLSARADPNSNGYDKVRPELYAPLNEPSVLIKLEPAFLTLRPRRVLPTVFPRIVPTPFPTLDTPFPRPRATAAPPFASPFPIPYMI